MHKRIAEEGCGTVITVYGYQDFLEKFEKYYELFIPLLKEVNND